MKRRKKVILICTTVVLLVAALLCIYFPADSRQGLSAVCRVKARSYYALGVDGKDTLYLYNLHDGQAKAALRPEATDDTVDVSGVFVSNTGHVLTTDSLMRRQSEAINGVRLKVCLQQLDTLTARKLKMRKAELEELDDYARKHSVVDDGYDDVMTYRNHTSREVLALDTLRQRLKKAIGRNGLCATLCSKVTVLASDDNAAHAAHVVVRKDGLVVLQLDKARLPQGATRCSVYRLGTYRYGAKLFAFNDFGRGTAVQDPAVLENTDTLYPATEGGAWINASGHLCGLLRGKERVGSWQIAQTLRRVNPWPRWWYTNLKARFTQDDEAERPAAVRRDQTTLAPDGTRCMRLELADTSVYEGHVSEQTGSTGARPMRHGYGTWRTKDGTVYSGLWQTDTLAYGTRTDSTTTYTGRFNALFQPEGHGWMREGEGTYYSGAWKNGKRSGPGFSVHAGSMVFCGEWKNNRFLGERMIYTTERIYGIDISRYQHEKGRKKYAIDWNKLRITSLGEGRRVQGNVDYPVSYVYIKSTEGRSVRNKYYAADLLKARKKGIPVGSYHFFSTTSTGAEQARHFLKYTWVAANDLPPVLDIEPSEAQIRKMGGDEKMFHEVRVWLQVVEKQRGKRPVLYVSQTFVNKHLSKAPDLLQKYEVWIARYGEYKPYVRLLHWQLTPYGRVRGIQPEVDINVFNGTREEFDSYLKRHGVKK